MIKRVEIIALIFKSVDYLELIYDEITSDKCKVEGWDIGVRIVANDATEPVLTRLKELGIPYTIYNDPKPGDYYLNRVYRCWNYGGRTSEYENICFVNSDMVFSDGWLRNLLKHHNGTNIPTSRLIESGKMPSGTHGVSSNCGRDPKHINYDAWKSVVAKLSVNETHEKGLYMPCVFNTSRFIESGMYPEGNIYTDGVGTLNGFVQSGDVWYFNKLVSVYGMRHITVFDSLVYHIQEGEKDS